MYNKAIRWWSTLDIATQNLFCHQPISTNRFDVTAKEICDFYMQVNPQEEE